MTRRCYECGTKLSAAKHKRNTCSTACRAAHHNRRKARGAELYDLFMLIRFERGLSRAKGLWSLACLMASHWKIEDDEAGRRSYGEAEDVLPRLAGYQAKRVGRV